MRGFQETPFYIRTDEGQTFYVDTLEEALDEFLGNEGYRLTLTAGSHELVIRRGQFAMDLNGTEAAAAIVRRNVEVKDT